ncbi:MAG: methyltransferase domain-containing protein [Proteobacteria bacterium]|nr:methyltransferase domain-containing protein [Pseudomonadota bacterium]
MIKNIARAFVVKTRSIVQSTWMSYPKKVRCNICNWEGRRFLSDSWHNHINCPKCRSGIRQRLFFAALHHTENLSFDKIIHRKNILHFAPEKIVGSGIRNKAAHYATADFFRPDCDFKVDVSNMPEIKNESYDIVIAFDVLEHVPDYQKALQEVHRVLTPNGLGIFTVPQKDNLLVTYEDPTIITPKDRLEHFGHWDHRRIFGDDFCQTLERKGFSVTAVDETIFSEDMKRRHVLLPPTLSKHPLATNFRKVFFCQKNL